MPLHQPATYIDDYAPGATKAAPNSERLRTHKAHTARPGSIHNIGRAVTTIDS
jgi:hypothetical protein